ncbi:hypothetical protein GCWU000341_02613 [Oribacterium sp. oral taxon 078 str. F0262]|nr:hypothetical protein GCWU000341_02613 [Oribacterium sp. oral taxon 078 str. F0262]
MWESHRIPLFSPAKGRKSGNRRWRIEGKRSICYTFLKVGCRRAASSILLGFLFFLNSLYSI